MSDLFDAFNDFSNKSVSNFEGFANQIRDGDYAGAVHDFYDNEKEALDELFDKLKREMP